jgi:hypothetical protein
VIAANDQLRPDLRPRLDRAALMFATDVLVCDPCGGAMRILAVLPKGEASHAVLENLGLPHQATCSPRARSTRSAACRRLIDHAPSPNHPDHVGSAACPALRSARRIPSLCLHCDPSVFISLQGSRTLLGQPAEYRFVYLSAAAPAGPARATPDRRARDRQRTGRDEEAVMAAFPSPFTRMGGARPGNAST